MAETTPTHINAATRYFGGMNMRGLTGGSSLATSTAWGTANLAWYLPFSLPWSYTVRRLFLLNGATASGNIDFGIYSVGGTKLGSTGVFAQTGTTVIQYASLASPLVLPAGNYFCGISLSSATGTVAMNINITANLGRLMGLYQQATAHPLPSPATFAAWNSTGYPLIGFTRTSTGY